MTPNTITISFIFPGQGAQTVGMGQAFYGASPQAQLIFDQADTIIPGLSDVIFNGPQEKLTSTAFCQPAIFTFSMAALEALKVHPKFKAINPVFAAGLSLGEYSALCAAGSLSFLDTLKLVERRSAHMDEATKIQKGAMTAVIGFDKQELIAICDETGAEVANFNAPDQIVITGDAEKVGIASEKIKEAGAKRVIPLDVSGAFHSSLMAPAVEKFKDDIKNATFNPAQFPVISNVDGKPATTPEVMASNLATQITSSVQWVDSIQYMAKEGVSTFLEIGPGTVLKGLIRKIDCELKVINIQKPEDIEGLEL